MENAGELHDKDAPGRGKAVLVYGLFLGAIMTIVTLPLGALLALYARRGAAPWVDTHLRFQLWTCAGLVLSAMVFALLWQSLGWLGLSPLSAWAMGYLYFTFALVWLVGRCAVGINRLMHCRPIAQPSSPLFGGTPISLTG